MTTPRSSSVTHHARPKLRRNDACLIVERWESCGVNNDWMAAQQCLNPAFEHVDHGAGSACGVDEWLESAQQWHGKDDVWSQTDALATLGDRLCLLSQRYGFSKDDEATDLLLAEVDEDGCWLRADRFEYGQMGLALLLMYQRYAEEQVGARQRLAQRIAASLQAFSGRCDLALVRKAISPDLDLVDHRSGASLEGAGSDALLAQLQAALEQAPSLDWRIDHIHRCAPRALCVQERLSSAEPATPDASDYMACVIRVWRTDGLLGRIELFDPQDSERALSRLVEIGREESKAKRAVSGEAGSPGSVPTPTPTPAAVPKPKVDPPLRNSATAAYGLVVSRFRKAQWDGVAEKFAEDVELEDRRAILNVRLNGLEGCLAYFRQLRNLPDPQISISRLATAGKNLCLHRMSFVVAEPGEQADLSAIDLVELDDKGQICRFTRYEPDDLDSAKADFEDRAKAENLPDNTPAPLPDLIESLQSVLAPVAEEETDTEPSPGANDVGTSSPRNLATLAFASLLEFMGEQDWDQLGALLSDGFFFRDHRSLTMLGHDRDEYIGQLQDLVNAVATPPDAEVLAVRGQRLALIRLTGGFFDAATIHLVVVDTEGCIASVDCYATARQSVAEANLERRWEKVRHQEL